MLFLRHRALAGHDADELAVAPGGQGLAPGNPFALRAGFANAIAEGGHTVNGIDEGTVVTQLKVQPYWLI